jgi:hypothetical protein
MFHEELGTNAMLLFLFKFFLKFFHVVVECRVELLEIDQGMTTSDRRRLLGLSIWLLGVDLLSFLLFVVVVQTNGISVVVLFAFEVCCCFLVILALGLGAIKSVMRLIV